MTVYPRRRTPSMSSWSLMRLLNGWRSPQVEGFPTPLAPEPYIPPGEEPLDLQGTYNRLEPPRLLDFVFKESPDQLDSEPQGRGMEPTSDLLPYSSAPPSASPAQSRAQKSASDLPPPHAPLPDSPTQSRAHESVPDLSPSPPASPLIEVNPSTFEPCRELFSHKSTTSVLPEIVSNSPRLSRVLNQGEEAAPGSIVPPITSKNQGKSINTSSIKSNMSRHKTLPSSAASGKGLEASIDSEVEGNAAGNEDSQDGLDNIGFWKLRPPNLNCSGVPEESSSFLSPLVPPIGDEPLASPLSKKRPKLSPRSTSFLKSPILTPRNPPEEGRTRASGKGEDRSEYQKVLEYISTKPTCSLNLVCYRSGAAGCELHQIQVAKASRFADEQAFQRVIKDNSDLLTTDKDFFQALRKGYRKHMCSIWRRIFCLKTLRGLRLLSFTRNARPTVVPLNTFILREVLCAYKNPSRINTDHEWIDWVFRLRQPDKRHAIEFVEGWSGTRIAIAGTVPLIVSTLVGVLLSVQTRDVQTAFTVAGFILTAGTRSRAGR